jgi:hypothetical protein
VGELSAVWFKDQLDAAVRERDAMLKREGMRPVPASGAANALWALAEAVLESWKNMGSPHCAHIRVDGPQPVFMVIGEYPCGVQCRLCFRKPEPTTCDLCLFTQPPVRLVGATHGPLTLVASVCSRCWPAPYDQDGPDA